MSDILANLEALPSNLLLKMLFRFTGSAPGYRVFNLAMKFIVRDRKQVLQALLGDMQALPPAVVVPAHGGLLSDPEVAQRTEQLLVEATA